MAKSFDTNLKNVAAEYLKYLKVKITASTIKQDIEEHSYYPSLLSLSDSFHRYNIDNEAFQLPIEKLIELPTPFIAFINLPEVGKDFVLVKKITNEHVSYVYESKKSKTISQIEFKKLYQNVVWLAEPEGDIAEKSYAQNLKAEKLLKAKSLIWTLGLAVAAILLIALNKAVVSVFSYVLILIVKILGIATVILLLLYELDKNNVFVKNICTDGAKTNCNAILTSKASKIAGISWSEIGFFYFSTTLLLLLFPGVLYTDKVLMIALANIVAVPYVFFSIYYQAKVAKQWCPLCLTVQALLVVELIWDIVYFWSLPIVFNIVSLPFIQLGLCSLAPMLVWYGIKPSLVKARDYSLYKAAYRRMQNNHDIFNGLLQQQPKVADGWQDLGIVIGNELATTTIIKVCNTFCGPCAKAHPVLEELIKNNPALQVRIIFTSTKFEEDKSSTVAKYLLAIAAEGNNLKTQQALDNWYLAETKSLEVFVEKYPVDEIKLEEQSKMLELMRDWCNKTEITYTPTIFINEYLLPDTYKLEDLEDILHA